MYWYLSRHHQLYNERGVRYGWGSLNPLTIMALVKQGRRIEILVPGDRRTAGKYYLQDNWIFTDDSKTPRRPPAITARPIW